MTQMLVALLLLSIIYYAGQFLWAIVWQMHEKHYFIGFRPRIFEAKVFDIKLSVGIYIPLPFLTRILRIEEGKSEDIRHLWEYYEFPKRKRLIAIFGGVFALFLSAIIMNIGVTYFQKDTLISMKEVNKYGIYPSSFGKEAGFKPGDKILNVDGILPDYFYDLFINSDDFEKSVFTILRGNKKIKVTIDPEATSNKYSERLFAGVLFPFEIAQVISGSIAEDLGLKAKDKILSINQVPITSLHEYNEELSKTTSDTAIFTISRPEENKIFEAVVPFNDDKSIGVFYDEIISYSIREYTLWESITTGILTTFNLFSSNTKGLVTAIGGEVTATHIGGPIGIAEVFSDDSIFNIRFWRITSILALSIVFYNLLPLPKSAITQTIPLTYEAITGSRFSIKNYERIKKSIYFLIALLILIIIFNDIINFVEN